MAKVGIVLEYQKCETTWVALQFANWLTNKAISCSILSSIPIQKGIDQEWDSKIQSHQTTDFVDFIRDCTHIIWFGSAQLFQLIQSSHSNIHTVKVCSWEDTIDQIKLYPYFKELVCSSYSLGHRLRSEFRNSKVTYIPLDLSLSNKTDEVIRPDKPKILINIRGSKNSQFGSLMSQMFSRWFHQLEAEWTLWIPKSLNHPKSWLMKCLKSPNSNSSFSFETKYDWETYQLIFYKNDLTLIPALKIFHGLSVVTSLSAGTPVVAFDVPPINEYTNKNNSILIPCQVKYDNNGLTSLMPDLTRFELYVTKLLNQKNGLQKLKKHTSDWSEERRKLFNFGWSELLGII